jgi:hypothetical protein
VQDEPEHPEQGEQDERRDDEDQEVPAAGHARRGTHRSGPARGVAGDLQAVVLPSTPTIATLR